MRAVDTNVLVRVLVNDDPGQGRRALALMRTHPVWVAKTVLLETEWVLRSLYQFDRQQIADALERLAGLANVQVEDPRCVHTALGWFRDGLDFADALHLASRGDAEAFVSFDARFRRRARRITGMAIEKP